MTTKRTEQHTPGLEAPQPWRDWINGLRADNADLEAENARIRSALQDACVFLALAADRGVLNGEEISGILEDYQAALGAK